MNKTGFVILVWDVFLNEVFWKIILIVYIYVVYWFNVEYQVMFPCCVHNLQQLVKSVSCLLGLSVSSNEAVVIDCSLLR